MRLMVCQSTSRHHTTPPCPLKVPKRSPFKDHHALGLESFAAQNNRSPSRLYLIWVMARSCPCNIRGFYKETTLNYKTYPDNHCFIKIRHHSTIFLIIHVYCHMKWDFQAKLTIFYEYLSRKLEKTTKFQAWHVAAANFWHKKEIEKR